MLLRSLCWTVLLVLLLSLSSQTHAQPAACTPQPTLKTGALLTWAPPVQPANIQTTGYEVWWDQGANTWTKAPNGDVGLSPAAYTVTGLTPGKTYAFGVKAVVKVANGTETGVSPFGAADTTAPPCLAILVVSSPTKVQATPQ